MAVQKTNTQNLSSLVINKVDTKTTFQNMLTNNQVNENELYFIPSTLDEDSEIFKIAISIESDAETGERRVFCNKSYNEILNAYNNDMIIYSRVWSGNCYISCNYDINTYDQIITFQYSGIDRISNNDYVFGYDLELSNNAQFSEQYQAYEMNIGTNYAIGGQTSNATLTIGSYTYDGSSAVNIPVYDGTYTWGVIL